jgi:hypothetical protein
VQIYKLATRSWGCVVLQACKNVSSSETICNCGGDNLELSDTFWRRVMMLHVHDRPRHVHMHACLETSKAIMARAITVLGVYTFCRNQLFKLTRGSSFPQHLALYIVLQEDGCAEVILMYWGRCGELETRYGCCQRTWHTKDVWKK